MSGVTRETRWQYGTNPPPQGDGWALGGVVTMRDGDGEDYGAALWVRETPAEPVGLVVRDAVTDPPADNRDVMALVGGHWGLCYRGEGTGTWYAWERPVGGDSDSVVVSDPSHWFDLPAVPA